MGLLRTTTDWLLVSKEFGEERFGDTYNLADGQSRRLTTLKGVARNDRLDGCQKPVLDFGDTLPARSKFKLGSGAGSGGVTSDVYLQLPLVAVEHIHHIFNEQADLCQSAAESPFWNLCACQNAKRPWASGDFRWICKSPPLQRLF